MKTKDVVFIALMAAVMSVLAQIAIPLAFVPVPFTLQVFGVVLAGLILNPADAFMSMLVYILLGTAGLPVFAQFEAGAAAVIGPKGGFLISFPLAAYVISLIVRKKDTWLLKLAGCAAGLAVIYAAGTLQLSAVTGMGMAKAVYTGALPFIPLDAAKAFLAAAVAKPVKRAVLSLSS